MTHHYYYYDDDDDQHNLQQPQPPLNLNFDFMKIWNHFSHSII